jgi:hypothetical protein
VVPMAQCQLEVEHPLTANEIFVVVVSSVYLLPLTAIASDSGKSVSHLLDHSEGFEIQGDRSRDFIVLFLSLKPGFPCNKRRESQHPGSCHFRPIPGLDT